MKKMMMTIGGLSLFTALFLTSIIFAGGSVRGESFNSDSPGDSLQNTNKMKKQKTPKKDKKDKNSNSMSANMMMNSTPTNDANMMMMNSSNVKMDANMMMMMNSNATIDANMMMNHNVMMDPNMMNANVAPMNSMPPSR